MKIALEMADGTIDITEVLEDDKHGYVLLTFAKEKDGYEIETTHDANYTMLMAGMETLRLAAKACTKDDLRAAFESLSPKAREFASKVGLTAENFTADPIMRMLMEMERRP